MRDEAPAQLPPLRLTQRGRVVLAVLAVVLLVTFLSIIRSCASGQPTAAVPASGTPSATGAASPNASGSATPAASTPASSPSASRTSILDGIRHGTESGSGKWTNPNLALTSTHTGKSSTHSYVVKVETDLDLDPAAVARQMQSILDDDRSWVGSTSNSFNLVTDEKKADLVIYLASANTTQRMCRPLDVVKTWSCNHGNTVIFNADRWRWMTPTYDDIDAYRAYMVNHEVGHFIGRGHLDCPGSGKRAPVMMQQSKSLGGCTPNPWPASSGGR